MGACTSGNKSPQRKSLENPPTDITEFQIVDETTLTLIQFEANLQNVKISSLKMEGTYGLLFAIDDIISYSCPITDSKQQKIKWDVNKTFRFSSNNYQIRKKQLRITLIDNKEKPLYTMKLNLYKLMTGPFHNDFKIKTNWTDCVEQGRIIFDLKISQIVEFTIESVQTDMQFVTEYPGDRFNYTLQAYIKKLAATKNYLKKLFIYMEQK